MKHNVYNAVLPYLPGIRVHAQLNTILRNLDLADPSGGIIPAVLLTVMPRFRVYCPELRCEECCGAPGEGCCCVCDHSLFVVLIRVMSRLLQF